jgi:hypothetical protein
MNTDNSNLGIDPISAKIIGTIMPLLNIGIEALRLDKDKAAASVMALPACFEYGIIGTKAYAKPDAKAIIHYYKHLRDIWLS